MRLVFLQFPPLPCVFTVDAPETRKYAQYARGEGNIVRCPVAFEPQSASALAVGLDHRVGVVYSTIE